jgi:membrane-associated phospholipid phosphatase
LERVNPHYLRILLVEHLKAGLTVEGKTGHCTVTLAGAEIFRINRPKDGANPSVYATGRQMDLVLVAADLRSDRLPEIILQQTDLLSFLGSTVRLHDVSHAWTLEVLRSVQDVATIVHSQVKHHLSTPRPVDVFPEASPIIQTPQHSSLPSGHTVEASAMAYVLSRLADKTDKTALSTDNLVLRMAARIAINRHVAGVHFPFESMAGFLLGISIGRICYKRLAGGTAPLSKYVITTDGMGKVDFHLRAFTEALTDPPGEWLTASDIPNPPGQTDELKHVYELTGKEWAHRTPKK